MEGWRESLLHSEDAAACFPPNVHTQLKMSREIRKACKQVQCAEVILQLLHGKQRKAKNGWWNLILLPKGKSRLSNRPSWKSSSAYGWWHVTSSRKIDKCGMRGKSHFLPLDFLLGPATRGFYKVYLSSATFSFPQEKQTQSQFQDLGLQKKKKSGAKSTRQEWSPIN